MPVQAARPLRRRPGQAAAAGCAVCKGTREERCPGAAGLLRLHPHARSPPPSFSSSSLTTQNRYLIILYYNATRHKQKVSLKDQEAELRQMQEKHGVDGEQRPAGKQ